MCLILKCGIEDPRFYRWDENPTNKHMLGARAGSEGTSEQFAPLLASLKKFYTQKTANQK